MQQADDIYSRITNKIITDLEKGELTWRKPWNADYLSQNVQRPLRSNGIPYTGINTIALWAYGAEKGYHLPHWMTFNQAITFKASVRKGEKGSQVIYADKFLKEEENVDGEKEIVPIPFLKTYTVFNACQIEGLPAHFYETALQITDDAPQRIEKLETFFAQTKADIRAGNKAAYYSIDDYVTMPPIESFQAAKDYYSVLAHEMTHWTKHPTRLNRDFGRKQWGDEGYAKEELVAEIGACFLAADLGFEPMPEENHAAYIQNWLKALQDDKRLIFSAASHAQKAIEFLHGFQTYALTK
ncbi:ArdC family protein [Emticicia fluvialis]|uniref:ArdC family protein n=1 Tax=Emticicia fluvialis TaxID=2974474 RepID=UPI002165B077|nr:zincin-like metallopeptidase domain-containing protein [Emticicia fluvialis]